MPYSFYITNKRVSVKGVECLLNLILLNLMKARNFKEAVTVLVLVLSYLLIFFARVIDISLATIRMIMVVRGKRMQAALIGFVEALVFVVAIGRVLNHMDDPINILMFALGFATGNYVGMWVEEKMALGNIIVQAITPSHYQDLTEQLREEGFGVTIVQGYGIKGTNNLVNITLQRKRMNKLMRIIDEYDKEIFVTVTDARAIRGGYFSASKRK